MSRVSAEAVSRQTKSDASMAATSMNTECSPKTATKSSNRPQINNLKIVYLSLLDLTTLVKWWEFPTSRR